MNRPTRRNVLKWTPGALAGLATLPLATTAAGQSGQAPAKRSLRLAHLTDIHLQPERAAADGLAKCLNHVQSLNDKPDLIITGGDLIMDGYDVERARASLQWDLFTRVMREHCSMRVEHTLGNHDIWGWQKERSKTTGDEPGWGKAWACDVLGMKQRYHAYDLAGWHIVHLDSTFPHPSYPYGYLGKLDDEQRDWLKNDLASVAPGTHTLIVSHIPILSITPFVGPCDEGYWIKTPGSNVHCDSEAIREILEKAGHVRACVSGHMHRLDRLDFRGIAYFCNGAVCGSWWRGPEYEAREGYALIDLYSDGTVQNTYVPYDWVPRE